MKELKKIEVEGDIIYLSKTSSMFFSKWHVVHPIKNEDGTFNIKHLIAGATWWNLVFVLLFVIIFLGAAIEYNNSLSDCKVAMEKLNLYEYKYNPAFVPEKIRNELGFNYPNETT